MCHLSVGGWEAISFKWFTNSSSWAMPVFVLGLELGVWSAL